MIGVDGFELLRLYEAVGGPVAKSNVEKAVRILKNGGKVVPGMYPKSEIRTYFRIKERLKEHGII